MNKREFIFRAITDERILIVIVGIAFLWRASVRYLKGMREKYRLLIKETPRKLVPAKSIKDAIFRVMTHERTLVVVIAAAILWRIAISSDSTITFWGSTVHPFLIQLSKKSLKWVSGERSRYAN